MFTHKLLQILSPNPFTLTTKCLQRNNTNFISESTQIYLPILS